MKGTKWYAAGAAALALTVGGGVAVAMPSSQHAVEFFKVTQDYPTNGIQRFIIRGDGCLKAEDMTKLRLVSYDPSHHKVVYRCLQP